jgi:hypothetical protein
MSISSKLSVCLLLCLLLVSCNAAKNSSPTYRGVNSSNHSAGQNNSRYGTLQTEGIQWVGQIRNGLAHGQGKYTYPNGDSFTGTAVNGRPVKGTVLYANGGVYKGQFHNGQRHGHGTSTLPNGEKYEGEWKKGKRHGQGTAYFPNGGKYIGGFKNDKFDGYATVIEANGTTAVGEFKNDQPHGNFIVTYADGRQVREVWNMGRKISSKALHEQPASRQKVSSRSNTAAPIHRWSKPVE